MLHVLQPGSLQSVRTFPHRRKTGNQFAAVGPWLYVTDDDGDLLEVDRRQGDIHRRFTFGIPSTHLRPLLFRGQILLPAGKTLFCIGKKAGRRDRMPDKGILRLQFVNSETGRILSGPVRIVWSAGLRWWSIERTLQEGRTTLDDDRCFPSAMTFEKRGYFFANREIRPQDRGKLIKISLKPVASGSRLVFRSILFNTDSSGLLSSSIPALGRLTRFLRLHPGMCVLIEGHTDSTGDKARNRTLSLARARVVQDFLIRNNIEAARLQIAGFGDTKPVADNTTVHGRRRNRRTEIKILQIPDPIPNTGQGKQNGQKTERD